MNYCFALIFLEFLWSVTSSAKLRCSRASVRLLDELLVPAFFSYLRRRKQLSFYFAGEPAGLVLQLAHSSGRYSHAGLWLGASESLMLWVRIHYTTSICSRTGKLRKESCALPSKSTTTVVVKAPSPSDGISQKAVHSSVKTMCKILVLQKVLF